MSRQFVTTDVFTDQLFGGNPLAVFPDGRGLSTEVMQAIAREFNLSETVFVVPPSDPKHTRALRIFTPVHELPFAGHPTIGAAFVLSATGEITLCGGRTEITLEEGVGPIRVTIDADGGAPGLIELSAPRPPEFGPPPPARTALAGVLGLSAEELTGDWPPRAASCGVPFLFIPVADRRALARAALQRPAWEVTLASFWAPSVYLITRDVEQPGSSFRARMFAPAHGVAEDPATGSAAAALAGLLADLQPEVTGSWRWIVEQGFEMGRPSLLHLAAEKSAGITSAVHVGGRAVLVSRGEIHLP